MKMLSGIVGLTLTSVAALSSATAGDYQSGGYKDGPAYTRYVPYTSWTGFYVGANIGGVWDDLKVTDIDGYAAAAVPGTKTGLTTDGVFGGGSMGYNIQRGPVVFGIEGDIGGMSLSDKKLLNGTLSGTSVGIDSGLYGDVTGRLGYVFDRSLVYAKGGFAFYDGENKFSTVTGSYSGNTTTNTFTGWTFGGGVEYKLNTAWSLKLEYQYFDFGRENFTVFNAAGAPFRFKDDLTVNSVKVGVNYFIYPTYLPLK